MNFCGVRTLIYTAPNLSLDGLMSEGNQRGYEALSGPQGYGFPREPEDGPAAEARGFLARKEQAEDMFYLVRS